MPDAGPCQSNLLCFMWSQTHGFSFAGRPERQRLGGKREKKTEERKQDKEKWRGSEAGIQSQTCEERLSYLFDPDSTESYSRPPSLQVPLCVTPLFLFFSTFNLFIFRFTRCSGGSCFVPGELVECNSIQKLDSYRRDIGKSFLPL